jgi:hypothetical protein
MRIISALFHDEAVRSVALIIIGFVLGQLNSYFTTRRERNKAIDSALSDLLDVRHVLVTVEAAMSELDKLGTFSEQVKSNVVHHAPRSFFWPIATTAFQMSSTAPSTFARSVGCCHGYFSNFAA